MVQLTTIHFINFTLKGVSVEVHKYHFQGSTLIARRVYHPHNRAWLECDTRLSLRKAVLAISRNVRIMGI